MRNWKSIVYLMNGNQTQKRAYEAINELGILEVLSGYNPILVGTIPIEIDIAGSDLDIICEVYDFAKFTKIVMDNFGECEGFKIRTKIESEKQIIVSNFRFAGFEFEIYATAAPVESLNGYGHMLIESRILSILGREFRENVIRLKTEGLKTEPAFAQILGLTGNPYDELLKLLDYSDQEIIEIKHKAKSLEGGICSDFHNNDKNH